MIKPWIYMEVRWILMSCPTLLWLRTRFWSTQKEEQLRIRMGHYWPYTSQMLWTLSMSVTYSLNTWVLLILSPQEHIVQAGHKFSHSHSFQQSHFCKEFKKTNSPLFLPGQVHYSYWHAIGRLVSSTWLHDFILSPCLFRISHLTSVLIPRRPMNLQLLSSKSWPPFTTLSIYSQRG